MGSTTSNPYDYGVRRTAAQVSAAVTSWTVSTAVNSKITASSLTEIRKALNTEQTVRSITATSFTAPSTGSKATASLFSQIVTLLNACRSNDISNSRKDSSGNTITSNLTWNQSIASKNKLSSAVMTELKNNINIVQKTCICQCYYCTCNCNYCTCNCNYCTCNCNYCTCNCDYCPCNCNYRCKCNCNY